MLHGDSPEEVREDPDVRFMLLQDNADKLAHNDKVTQQRVDALAKADGTFTPPDDEQKITLRERINDPTFQKVALRSDGIVAGRVKAGNKSWPIKLVRAVK